MCVSSSKSPYQIVPFGLLVVLTVGNLVCSSGCQLFDRFRQNRSNVPVVLDSQPSLDQLIVAIQGQTQQVRQLKTDVRVTMDGLPATLRGDLQLERPSRLRLQAGVMNMNELGFDLGSNDEYFWIWKKAALPNDPPMLYYARHIDYQTSPLQQMTQLQPQWLLDALGFVEFRPTDRHTGPFAQPNGRIAIQSYIQTPTDTRVRVCEIDPKRALVLRQTFYDGQGRQIAFIDSSHHTFIAEQQASLPQQIVINVANPQGGHTKLTVLTGNYVANALYGDPQRLWEMPNPPDVAKVDLSR